MPSRWHRQRRLFGHGAARPTNGRRLLEAALQAGRQNWPASTNARNRPSTSFRPSDLASAYTVTRRPKRQRAGLTQGRLAPEGAQASRPNISIDLP